MIFLLTRFAQNTVKTGIVHSSSLSGHRKEYLTLLKNIFDFDISIGNVDFNTALKLVLAPHVIFSSLDDDIYSFCTITILRSLLRRKSVGLFIRPQSCFDKGMTAIIKRMLFMALRRIPRISILTIVPHDFDKRYASISTGWVHDPQLWDLGGRSILLKTELSKEIKQNAKGRCIVLYLGRISFHKGFRTLVELIGSDIELQKNIYFSAVGVVDSGCEKLVQKAKCLGMHVKNRFASHDELLSLYSVADMIWCCYDPTYDQASGIFGRCVQFGKIAIVRKGSTIEHYNSMVNADLISIDPSDMAGSARVLLMNSSSRPEPQVSSTEIYAHWKDHFIEKLEKSF